MWGKLGKGGCWKKVGFYWVRNTGTPERDGLYALEVRGIFEGRVEGAIKRKVEREVEKGVGG